MQTIEVKSDWTDKELSLIAMQVPTKRTRKMLAKSLHREENDIQSIQFLLYLSDDNLRSKVPTDLAEQIIKIKNELGLLIGIE